MCLWGEECARGVVCMQVSTSAYVAWCVCMSHKHKPRSSPPRPPPDPILSLPTTGPRPPSAQTLELRGMGLLADRPLGPLTQTSPPGALSCEEHEQPWASTWVPSRGGWCVPRLVSYLASTRRTSGKSSRCMRPLATESPLWA